MFGYATFTRLQHGPQAKSELVDIPNIKKVQTPVVQKVTTMIEVPRVEWVDKVIDVCGVCHLLNSRGITVCARSFHVPIFLLRSLPYVTSVSLWPRFAVAEGWSLWF